MITHLSRVQRTFDFIHEERKECCHRKVDDKGKVEHREGRECIDEGPAEGGHGDYPFFPEPEIHHELLENEMYHHEQSCSPPGRQKVEKDIERIERSFCYVPHAAHAAEFVRVPGPEVPRLAHMEKK